MPGVLLFSVFVVATCGLVYELVAGALASYLLGDSVTQFSTVIGAYLSAMGVGSYLSRYVKGNLIATFIRVELLVGFLGGVSAAFLFLIFQYAYSFRVVLYLDVFLVGMLVGLEIPLLLRILRDRMEFSHLISQVLSFDYIGALAASILFPLVLVPHLGLVRTCFMFGILNVLVALWAILLFSQDVYRLRIHKFTAIALLILLTFGFIYSDKILSFSETALYPDRVIYAHSSPYQRIVVTKNEYQTALYLNGHLQFDSRDEYRYHEALVHVGLQSVPQRGHVLVLGGGDGMAVREILKYPDVESITMVDLDQEMTDLFTKSEVLSALNSGSLSASRLKIIHEDAFIWLREHADRRFDFIAIDLPDPTNYSLGKLYTNSFYQSVKQVLADTGLIVVQSTSPLLARQSFWCVHDTLAAAGLHTKPYHVYVPSFGEWGFVLAGKNPVQLSHEYLSGLKFLHGDVLPSLLYFPPDMQQVDVEVNRLTNQVLVRYYDQEWSRYVS